MWIFKRFILTTTALLMIMSAFALIIQTSLPERAHFTGQIIEGEGLVAPEINSTAPLFENMTLTGDTLQLKDLRGQPVIVNFWATWCGPCKVEMPELQRLYEEFSSKGLRILAVNLGEPTPIVAQWVEENEFTYDILIDDKRQTATSYQLRGQPSTYMIAPDGTITHIYYGPTSADTLKANLQPLLNG